MAVTNDSAPSYIRRPALVNSVDAHGAKPLLAVSRRDDLGGDLKTALRDIILPHVLEGKAERKEKKEKNPDGIPYSILPRR